MVPLEIPSASTEDGDAIIDEVDKYLRRNTFRRNDGNDDDDDYDFNDYYNHDDENDENEVPASKSPT